jgi:hypothetical protein
MSESRFSQVGWYAFSVSDNKTVSDALGELGLTTDNVGNNLYTLANEPIQQGETLTNDSWTPISKDDQTVGLIEKFKSYWLLLESVPEAEPVPEVAEFGTDNEYLNVGKIISDYLKPSDLLQVISGNNYLSYNNYIGQLKGIEISDGGDMLWSDIYLFSDGYIKVPDSQAGTVYSTDTPKTPYTGNDINNDLTITYRQSKLDVSKYRLEIAVTDTDSQFYSYYVESADQIFLFISQIFVKLPVDFAIQGSAVGFNPGILIDNYGTADDYHLLNNDGTWLSLGSISKMPNLMGYASQSASTYDEYLQIKNNATTESELNALDGSMHNVFTHDTNSNVLEINGDLISTGNYTSAFQLSLIDTSNSDNLGANNVFIDGIHNFASS